MTLSTDIKAQEINAEKTASRKDSLLMGSLQKTERDLYIILLQNLASIEINQETGYTTYNLGIPSGVSLLNHSLRFICVNNKEAEIRFPEMTDYKLKIYSVNNNIQNQLSVTEHKLKIGSTVISVRNGQQSLLKAITNYFIDIQKKVNDWTFRMNEFEKQVTVNHALSTKPNVTEEQRKYIIQAEAYTQLYDYEKAIELNKRIIAIHSTSYPNAYFNLAILLGETNRLHSAVYNMKKFLMLNKDSMDEQDAKARISEWEIILNN